MNNRISTASDSCNNICAAVTRRVYQRVGRGRSVTLREQMTNVDGCCTIAYISEFLGHADLRERMVSDGYLQADGLPYQHYLDCGYLTAVESDEPGRPDVLVTPHGMSWLYNHYGMTDEARTRHQSAKTIQ